MQYISPSRHPHAARHTMRLAWRRSHRMVMAMNAPVRPTPELQWTSSGPASLLRCCSCALSQRATNVRCACEFLFVCVLLLCAVHHKPVGVGGSDRSGSATTTTKTHTQTHTDTQTTYRRAWWASRRMVVGSMRSPSGVMGNEFSGACVQRFPTGAEGRGQEAPKVNKTTQRKKKI